MSLQPLTPPWLRRAVRIAELMARSTNLTELIDHGGPYSVHHMFKHRHEAIELQRELNLLKEYLNGQA